MELGDSLEDNSPAYQRLLGQIIAKIDLEQISFNLPQLTPFTIGLNSLFNKRIEMNLQHSLRAFKLNGGEISDKSIELLCKNFPQLHAFHLSHSSYLSKENFLLTQRIYQYIAGLHELRSLIINGLTNLDNHCLALILANCRHLTEIDLTNCRLITSESLVQLAFYAKEVNQIIQVFLWGTGIDLLDDKLNDDRLFTSNLKINLEPSQESLMDFDIIEDDFEFL